MIKKQIYLLFVLGIMFLSTACSSESNQHKNKIQIQASPDVTAETSSGKILIAYFTLADNYESPSDMDATSQASINIENKELIGNTAYLANAIQEENARPELFSHVENMEQYQTVYLGFPIWLAYHNLIQCTQA